MSKWREAIQQLSLQNGDRAFEAFDTLDATNVIPKEFRQKATLGTFDTFEAFEPNTKENDYREDHDSWEVHKREKDGESFFPNSHRKDSEEKSFLVVNMGVTNDTTAIKHGFRQSIEKGYDGEENHSSNTSIKSIKRLESQETLTGSRFIEKDSDTTKSFKSIKSPKSENEVSGRDATGVDLATLYATLGERYGAREWRALSMIEGWTEKFYKLERAFTQIWQAGGDPRDEFTALREHWCLGIGTILKRQKGAA
jgi:hypothetical protein